MTAEKRADMEEAKRWLNEVSSSKDSGLQAQLVAEEQYEEAKRAFESEAGIGMTAEKLADVEDKLEYIRSISKAGTPSDRCFDGDIVRWLVAEVDRLNVANGKYVAAAALGLGLIVSIHDTAKRGQRIIDWLGLELSLDDDGEASGS